MTDALEIRSARPDELAAHGALLEHGYAFLPPYGDRAVGRLDAEGATDRVLAAYRGSELVGTTTVWPMAQWFGGRSVAMGGIGGVVVRADQRGRGVCSALLTAAVEAMRTRGEVISALGPATVGVYRRAGWELAIDQHWRRVPLDALGALPDGLGRERPATAQDRGAIEAVHTEVSRRAAGRLRRSTARWDDRLAPSPATSWWVVEADGEVRAYIAYTRRRRARGGYDLIVDDFAALDWDVERTLWRHLAAHRAQTDAAVVHGLPLDGLAVHLGEQVVTLLHAHQWMLRLVDAPGAVAARGYPAAVDCAVDLALDDPVVAAHRGPFRLQVAAATATLESGGSGRCAIGIGAFSALWAGAISARTLAANGMLRGADERDLAALDAVFSGPRPTMNDDF